LRACKDKVAEFVQNKSKDEIVAFLQRKMRQDYSNIYKAAQF